MGAGVAGLRAAVELARYGDVLVVTKESVGESNTHYAQGGIAVAMEGDEDIALHLEDTVNAGDGLVYRPAAKALVSEGPLRVAELIEWGANFDRELSPEGDPQSGDFLRTREGAALRIALRRPRSKFGAPTRSARPRAAAFRGTRFGSGAIDESIARIHGVFKVQGDVLHARPFHGDGDAALRRSGVGFADRLFGDDQNIAVASARPLEHPPGAGRQRPRPWSAT